MVPLSIAGLFLHSAAAPKCMSLAPLPVHNSANKTWKNIQQHDYNIGRSSHAWPASRPSPTFGYACRKEVNTESSTRGIAFCLNASMGSITLGSPYICFSKKSRKTGASCAESAHFVLITAAKQSGSTSTGGKRLFQQPIKWLGEPLPRRKNFVPAHISKSYVGTRPVAAMSAASLSSSLSAVGRLTSALDFSVLQSSCKTSVNLVSLCTLVVWMQRSGQLPADTPVILSQVAFRLFIPCFLLSKVATTLTESSVSNLAALPLMAIIQVIIGICLGKLASQIFFKVPSLQEAVESMEGDVEQQPSSEDQKMVTRAVLKKRALITASCGFGNSLTLPLVFMAGVLSTAEDLSRAAGYLALFMVGWSPAMWTVGYKILTSGDEVPESESKDDHSFWQTMIKWTQEVMNPPLYGVLVGVLVGGTPLSHLFLQKKGAALANSSNLALFLSPGIYERLRDMTAGLLSPVFEAAALLGTATLAVQTVVLATSLGASLPKPKEKGSPAISLQDTATDASIPLGDMENIIPKSDVLLDSKAFWAISFVRLILLPLSGILLTLGLQRYNLLPADPVYRLVILAESAMPTAQNLVLLAQLNAGTRPLAGMLAELLLRQYALSIVSLTMWMAVFLKFSPLS